MLRVQVDDDDDDDDDEPPTLATAEEMHRALSLTRKWFRFSGTILGGQPRYANLRPVFGYLFWYPLVGRFSIFSSMFLATAAAS